MCTRGYLLGKTVGGAANDHETFRWLLKAPGYGR
jgi:hypothetical protein